MPAGLTLREILKMADALNPGNTVAADLKVSAINQLVNQYFRDYPVLEAVSPITVTAGLQFYVLPDECPVDRVSRLTLDSMLYPYVAQGSNLATMPDNFCTLVAGKLMISPKPIRNMFGLLYYKPRPSALGLDNLDAISSFPVDFHDMLVYGCAARIADIMGNDKKVDRYETKVAILGEKADRVIVKPRQQSVNRSRNWS